MLKNLPTIQETWVLSLGWEDALEKEMANHSNILAWRLPGTEGPDRLQSLGLQRVEHDWVTNTYLQLPDHSVILTLNQLWILLLRVFFHFVRELRDGSRTEKLLDFFFPSFIYCFIIFLLEDNCFTMSWWSLPYIKANQS